MENTNILTTTTETTTANRSYSKKEVAGIGALAFLLGAGASAGYRKVKSKFFSGEKQTPPAPAAETPAQ